MKEKLNTTHCKLTQSRTRKETGFHCGIGLVVKNTHTWDLCFQINHSHPNVYQRDNALFVLAFWVDCSVVIMNQQITNSPKSKNEVSKEFRSNKKGKNYPIHHPSYLKRIESDNNTFGCLPLTKYSLNQEDKGCLAFLIQVYIKCASVKGRKWK